MDHRHHSPPPPPPQPAYKTLDHDSKSRHLLPLSFANGTLKKHLPPPPAAQQRRPHASVPSHDHLVYRECLKNHAASIGGHALDGCGEFMPSPNTNPSNPASLTCAACGCHRNFHRRLLHGVAGEDERVGGRGDHRNHHRHLGNLDDDDERWEDDDGDEGVDEEEQDHNSPPPPPPPHQNQLYSSAPHMLLALSNGFSGGTGSTGPVSTGTATAATTTAAAAALPRKRFRTKFSAEQKERMHELSERLGWRMQKQEEGLVEECCREIGVGRGVFKVWMHNNKHNFATAASLSRKRGEAAPSSSGGGGGGGGAAGGGNEANNNNTSIGNDGNGNGSSSNHVVNGSSPSSS